MIAIASQFRDWDIALMIFLLAFAMFVPDLIEGIRNYRRGRRLAQRITQEHAAREALRDRWQ
jgi:membrane protein CcdC involved in cytochrome C biogenesis